MKIFTAYKPEANARIRKIQSASRTNWAAVFPTAEIVDVSDLALVPALEHLSQDEACLWANADLLFDSRLLRATATLTQRFPQGFLAVGQRTDTHEDGSRTLGRVAAMDYFACTAGALKGLPSVTMGRGYCDSAILVHCLRRGIPTVDLSYAVAAVHQYHDYGHLDGGQVESYGGPAAQANLKASRLRPYPPNIIDCSYRLTPRGRVTRNGRRSFLRRLETEFYYRRGWGGCPRFNALWNRLTHGGRLWWNPSVPTPLERPGRVRATYATRAGLSYWTPNHAPVQNALFAAENTNLELHVDVGRPRADYIVPPRIADRCAVFYHRSCVGLALSTLRSARRTRLIFTGFDYPCMILGWLASKLFSCRWICFVWDPPVLWLRDAHPRLRRLVDFFFKRLASTADKIVLQIHPGLLRKEMAYCPPRADQVVESSNGLAVDCGESSSFRASPKTVVRLGVLASATKAKGFDFLSKACAALPGVTMDWIGAGEFVSQPEAYRRLAEADILVYPYLDVPSVRWNYALKLYEYAAFGKPIVCADLPGARHVLSEVSGVFYFTPGDATSFVSAVEVARHAPKVPPADLSRFSYARVHADLARCLGLLKGENE